jgi:hypothetical protein
MSSSFLENLARALRASGAALAVTACWVSVAAAADSYFIPTVTAGGEYDTNRAMATTGDNQGLTGYSGTAEAVFGAATPRGATEVRPRVRYQAFPSRTQLNQTEGSLNFKSNFLTPRTEFNLVAGYQQLDLFNAEFVNVGFDPFDPNPTTDAGQPVFSETRKEAQVNPTFLYRWSETMGIGAELEYEDTRYTADVPLSKQDYDNWQTNLYLQRRASPKTTVQVGGYVGRFQTKSGVDTTDSVVGAAFDIKHDWTTRNHSELALTVERNKIDVHEPGVAEESTTDVGVEFSTIHRGEVSTLRLVLGRDISPTGEGGRATSDQIRAQYDRSLSARLSFTGVLAGFRQRALANQAINIDSRRDLATGELSLQWMMTPTWFVRGGYGYNYQKRSSTPGSANNNRAFLTFGYQALDSRRHR